MQGRVPCRHSLSQEHRGPRSPFFSPLVEAYDDQGGRCAASWGLELAITFTAEDFIFPRFQCRPPPSGPLHDVDLYAEGLHAQREAAEIHRAVMFDDLAFTITRYNDSQPYSNDPWCSVDELDFTFEEDSYHFHGSNNSGSNRGQCPHAWDHLLTCSSREPGCGSDTPYGTPDIVDHGGWNEDGVSSDNGQGRTAATRPLAIQFARTEDMDLLLLQSLGADSSLVIHSFGYKARDLGRRTLTVAGAELRNWRRLLREQWSDHYTTPPFLIFPIRPPPFLAANTISIIVQLGDIAAGEALALTQVVTDDSPVATPLVVSIPFYSSKQMVCEAAGVHPRLHSLAVVKQGFVPWMAGFPRQVRDGDFLRILVEENIVDEASFTQGGRPTLISTPLCRPPTTTTRLLDSVRTRAQSRASEAQGIEQEQPERRLPPHQGGANRLFPWHLWEQLFNNRLDTEDAQVNLAFYGLALEPLGTRYGWTQALSRPTVIRQARMLFPEMMEWDMMLHLVTPQPQDQVHQIHVLAEFLREDVVLGNMVPILIDVRWFEPRQLRREHRAAAYIATPTNKWALLEDLAAFCQPEGEMLCSVWTRGIPCLEFMTASLHRGDLISVRMAPSLE